MKAELLVNKRENLTPYIRYKKIPGQFDLEKLKQLGTRIVPALQFISVAVLIFSFIASIVIKLESREMITQFGYAMKKVVWLAL
jgi:hypothetical protein